MDFNLQENFSSCSLTLLTWYWVIIGTIINILINQDPNNTSLVKNKHMLSQEPESFCRLLLGIAWWLFVMGWIMSPRILMLKPYPQHLAMWLYLGPLKGIKLKIRPIGLVDLQEAVIRTQTHTGNTYEDMVRGAPSITPETPQKKPTLSIPWSWTSCLQDCDKIGFCGLSSPVYGTDCNGVTAALSN